MPHRSGLPDGLITIWGKITLAQLDQETVKGLSEGKNPKKGLLIDSSAILYDQRKKVYPSIALKMVLDLFGEPVST